MPEYVLRCWSVKRGSEATVERFFRKNNKAAVRKAIKIINDCANVLRIEHRFILEEVKNVPLPAGKHIINLGKKEPKVTPGLTVTTECIVTKIPKSLKELPFDAGRDRNYI